MVDFIRSLGKRYWKIINIIRMQAPKWHWTKEKLDEPKTTGTKIMSQTNAIVQFWCAKDSFFYTTVPMACIQFICFTNRHKSKHMYVYMLKEEKNRAFITWIDLLSFRLNLNFQWNIVRICCYNIRTKCVRKKGKCVRCISRLLSHRIQPYIVCSSLSFSYVTTAQNILRKFDFN